MRKRRSRLSIYNKEVRRIHTRSHERQVLQMATRISKNGNTYNVPTVKSTYLAKDEKALLHAFVAKQLEEYRAHQAELSLAELAMISKLVALQQKLA